MILERSSSGTMLIRTLHDSLPEPSNGCRYCGTVAAATPDGVRICGPCRLRLRAALERTAHADAQEALHRRWQRVKGLEG